MDESYRLVEIFYRDAEEIYKPVEEIHRLGEESYKHVRGTYIPWIRATGLWKSPARLFSAGTS